MVSSFCIPINGNVMVVSRFYKSDIIALGIFLYRNYLSETGIAPYGPYRNRLGFISIQRLGKSLFRIIPIFGKTLRNDLPDMFVHDKFNIFWLQCGKSIPHYIFRLVASTIF